MFIRIVRLLRSACAVVMYAGSGMPRSGVRVTDLTTIGEYFRLWDLVTENSIVLNLATMVCASAKPALNWVIAGRSRNRPS